jgi:hypothetical protein
MALWYFGRTFGGRRRVFPMAVHIAAVMLFLSALLLAVFVFASRLF